MLRDEKCVLCIQKRTKNSVTEAKKNLNKEERRYSDVDAKYILRTLSIMAELQIETEKYKMEHTVLLKDNANVSQ